MSDFSFIKTDIEGAYLISSFSSEDNRGIFVKNFEKDIFAQSGIKFSCNEIFYSYSTKNVIRGMHFQTNNPQAKLVGVISGRVYDVIVDLRRNSTTYGQWRGFYLSSINRNSLLIPKGCAHGFASLAEESIVSYVCDGAYDRNSDTGIRFDDPDINIEWPINRLDDCVVSAKDRKLMSFHDFEQNFSFGE